MSYAYDELNAAEQREFKPLLNIPIDHVLIMRSRRQLILKTQYGGKCVTYPYLDKPWHILEQYLKNPSSQETVVPIKDTKSTPKIKKNSIPKEEFAKVLEAESTKKSLKQQITKEQEQAVKRGRGRPKGSKNKPKDLTETKEQQHGSRTTNINRSATKRT